MPKLRKPARVEIDGEDLVWVWREKPQSPMPTRDMPDQELVRRLKAQTITTFELTDAPADLALRFARLDGQSHEAIRRFAAEWGPLCLDADGFPCGPLFGPRKPRLQPLPREARTGGREPLSGWAQWVALVRTTLNLAAHLARNNIGPDDDWRRLDPERLRWLQASRQAAQEALTLWANRLMHRAHVEPWFTPTPTGVTFALDPAGYMFGAVVTQLVFLVNRTDALAACSGCGQVFAPTRKPRPDQRSYCSQCREQGVSRRDARRDYIARKPGTRRGNRRAGGE